MNKEFSFHASIAQKKRTSKHRKAIRFSNTLSERQDLNRIRIAIIAGNVKPFEQARIFWP